MPADRTARPDPSPRAPAQTRVLLLAPTARDGEVSRRLLASAGVGCDLAPTVDALCDALPAGVGAVVLPEEAVLHGGTDPLSEHLRRQPVWSDLPVIVLARAGADPRAVDRALSTLGNVSVVERPVRVSILLSTIRSALRARERQYQVRDHLAEDERAAAALRASAAHARFLADLAQAVRGLADPASIVAAAVDRLGQHLAADRCAYADVAADGRSFTIRHAAVAAGLPTLVGTYPLASAGAGVAARLGAGRTVVVADVEADPGVDAAAAGYRQAGIRAAVCCPLVKGGRLVALVFVHAGTPREWAAAEVELVAAVAERSWADIERAKAVREMERSEAGLRQMADAMPQIVWAARPDGTVDYYNRRWYEYTGLPPADPGDGGREPAIFPDDAAGIAHAWAESVRTGRPHEAECRYRRASDGTYRWHLSRALPIRGPDGRVLRWFGTNTDIHDQKELQAEAERQGRMKDEFLATLSHELRTPLNAILGWTQILAAAGPTPDPADVVDGLAAIDRNARAQTQIIEDLLDMSRVISGKMRLDLRPVDPVRIVHDAIGTVRPAAAAKHVRLAVTTDGVPAPLGGDPHRLQQVFWNLFANAVKFTPTGGRVDVRLGWADGHVHVAVADTGEGIAPAFLPFVFDRFRQADATTTRRHGGLGLGLAIVKQLVELHGGRVSVHSDGPGRGTTFTVELPLAPRPAAAAPAPDAGSAAAARPAPDAAAVAAARGRLVGLRVLALDDEPDARAVLRRLLEDAGAVVRTAGSAAEAMALLETEVPDVLVSDVGLPGEDGYGLIARIRRRPAGAGGAVPAVALTAYARASDRAKALAAGFNAHLVKPVVPADLIVTLADLTSTGNPAGVPATAGHGAASR